MAKFYPKVFGDKSDITSDGKAIQSITVVTPEQAKKIADELDNDY
jgi:hypothetical protein